MSTAKLNVWVTERGKPCRIPSTTEHVRFVHVLHCDGTVLEWCGKRYVNIPTKCGHVELEVPPGCYVVGAAQGKSKGRSLGNYLTHLGIVRVECGDHACVTLFDSTFGHCGHWFLTAIRTQLEVGDFPREAQATARAAAQAVEALLRTIPADEFTTQHAKSVETAPTGGTAPKAARKGGKKGGDNG